MATIASATSANHNVDVRELGIQRIACLEEIQGGQWVEISRELCPLTDAEAQSLMSAVNTVATPTYNRVMRLVTEGNGQ